MKGLESMCREIQKSLALIKDIAEKHEDTYCTACEMPERVLFRRVRELAEVLHTIGERNVESDLLRSITGQNYLKREGGTKELLTLVKKARNAIQKWAQG